MLIRLRHLLARDHAVHLAGVQLALVVMMSAGLAIAAPPEPGAQRRAVAALAQPVAVTQAVAETSDEAVIRLQDMSPEAARIWNASNPVSTLPNPAARPFRLEAQGALDEARAIDCMTAVIYYEAAYETTDGQRAVAQVVLNRMRHPAFPKTVCGVVFQGSTRTTGCQFTFTCDGALAHKPTDEGWARARKVAEASLNGYVMRKVGNATHYHAAYVAPYWSPSLVKVGTIGAHIFYRWTGGAGLPPAFGGRYAGGESASVQMATLDKLGRAETKLELISAPDAASSVAPTVIDVAPAAVTAQAEPELITAASVAKDVVAITKPEDLDWQGRPKAATPPRLAMPSSMF